MLLLNAVTAIGAGAVAVVRLVMAGIGIIGNWLALTG